MIIEWSPKDQGYVVTLPERAGIYTMPSTDGKTYEEAAMKGRNVLENFMQFAQEDGLSLPTPRAFAAA
jgi:predicted RNase H-like HicB family nuclease